MNSPLAAQKTEQQSTGVKRQEEKVTHALLERDLQEEMRLPTDGQLSLDVLPGNRIVRLLTPVAKVLLGEKDGAPLIATLRTKLEARRKRALERQARLEEYRRAAERRRIEREHERARERKRQSFLQKQKEEAAQRARAEARAQAEAERKRVVEERARVRAARAQARAEKWRKIRAPFLQLRERLGAWRREQTVRREQARAERFHAREERRHQREAEKLAREEAAKRREEERKQIIEEAKRAREEERAKHKRERAARAAARREWFQHFFQRAPKRETNEIPPTPVDEARIAEEARKEAMRQILIEQEKQKLLLGAEREKEKTQLQKEIRTSAKEESAGAETKTIAELEKRLAAERAPLKMEKERIRTEALAEAERRFSVEREALKAAAAHAAGGTTHEAPARPAAAHLPDGQGSDGLVSELRKQLAASEAQFALERDHIKAEALAEAEARIRTEVAAGKERGETGTQPSALTEELAKWKQQVEKLEAERKEIEQRRALQEEQERARKEQKRLEEERMDLERQRIARERAALDEEKMHKLRIAERKKQLREEQEQLEEEKKRAVAARPGAPVGKQPTQAAKKPPQKDVPKGAPAEQVELDIGHILLAQNYLDEAELTNAQAKAKERNIPLEHVLRDEGLATKEILQNAIAEYYKLPFVDLRSQPPDPSVLELLPQAFSVSYGAVAIQKLEDGTLVVATSSPERSTLESEIRKILPTIPKLSLACTSRESIESALGFYRKPLETRFRAIIEERKKVAPEIIEEIFNDAMQLGASDIHFEPQEKVIIVRFRVDGVMHEAGRIPKEYYEGIVNRTKIAGNMRIDEHFSAQDGAIRWRGAPGKAMDVRVSIVPIVDGEKIVLRLLSEYVRTLTLGDLGFTTAQRELLIEAANKPFGMILTTGPTGSGKSTTLYGLMKICNTPDVNISTIEDPVEYKIPGINHIQVNVKTDLSFERGLRALVRQDPDIILVGEIRDNITAQISVNAALTGHLLFSTLHANDAATAIPRLLEMGVEPYLLASTLELIIAQRLMRRICLHCRFSTTIPRSEACALFQNAARYFGEEEGIVTLYRGKGCPACGGTGYRGRIGIYEILDVTPAVEEMIVQRRTTAEINTMARQGGMATLFEDGLLKVKAGQSTIEELLRVAAPPDPLPEDPSSPLPPRS